MANQLVGRANMALIADLQDDPAFEFYCMVDHPDNVAALGAFFVERGQRLNVMIEYGVVGGRCGCRTEDEVLAFQRGDQGGAGAGLCGIEGYEGVITANTRSTEFVRLPASLVRLALQLQREGAFALDKPIITASVCSVRPHR